MGMLRPKRAASKMKSIPMNTQSNPKVSPFERVDASQKNIHNATINELLESIRDGKWREKVGRVLEEVLCNGRESAQVREAKKALPVWTPSGVFNARNNQSLVEHSGHIGLDLDDVPDLKGTQHTLTQCPHVRAAWTSPTNTGLPVEVAVTPFPTNDAEHKVAWNTAVAAVERSTGLNLSAVGLDQATKDLARAFFLSYDPTLQINSDPVPVPWSHSEASQDTARNPNFKPSKDMLREMLGFIPKRPADAEWIKVIAGVGDCIGHPIKTVDAVELLKAWSPEETIGEYTEKLKHRLDHVGVGALEAMARKHGWRPSTGIEVENVELVELARSKLV